MHTIPKGSDSCVYSHSGLVLSPNYSQLALFLNNHSFQLQLPAAHASLFIRPFHPSIKHPHRRTTLLFVCPKTRGTPSHLLFTLGHLHEVLFSLKTLKSSKSKQGSSVEPCLPFIHPASKMSSMISLTCLKNSLKVMNIHATAHSFIISNKNISHCKLELFSRTVFFLLFCYSPLFYFLLLFVILITYLPLHITQNTLSKKKRKEDPLHPQRDN